MFDTNALVAALNKIKDAIAASCNFLKRSSDNVLTPINSADRLDIKEIRALDSDGLKLREDGGNGIFVKDGGNVGIREDTPIAGLHVVSPNTNEWAGLFVEHGVTPETSSVINATKDKALSLQASGGAYFMGRDVSNNIEFIMGTSVSGNAFAGSMTYHGFQLRTNNASRMTILRTGEVGVNTISPTAKLDINSDILRLRTSKTPATSGSAGNAGDICWDSDYIYVCVATNTWKRTAISTW